MATDVEHISDTRQDVLPAPCANCTVRNSSLCGALDNDELRELNAISRRKTLLKGQFHAFESGGPADFVNVISGFGKLVRGSVDGSNQILGLLVPSDFVSNHSESDLSAANAYSIEAVTDLEICLFPREKFEPLLRRHPELERRLLTRTLDELRLAREWMVLLARKSAAERVASFLLHVASRMSAQSCQQPKAFDLPLDRADIADHIGLTVETVSRQFSKLRLDRVIGMDGPRRITEIDFDALTARAGHEVPG